MPVKVDGVLESRTILLFASSVLELLIVFEVKVTQAELKTCTSAPTTVFIPVTVVAKLFFISEEVIEDDFALTHTPVP